jgi:hypothetical protein
VASIASQWSDKIQLRKQLHTEPQGILFNAQQIMLLLTGVYRLQEIHIVLESYSNSECNQTPVRLTMDKRGS